MLLRIPIVVIQTKTGYSAKPLFFEKPVRDDYILNRLLTRLGRELTDFLESLGKKSRHDELAQWAFAPPVSVHRLSLRIELRRRIANVKYLFVAFDHFDRRLAFATAVPNLWFEVPRGEKLEDRATDVLTEYWRTVEHDAVDDEPVKPESLNLTGKSWVQGIDVSIRIPLKLPEEPQHPFLMIGGGEPADGAAELRRVGRCLDHLYPDELDRAVLRERETAELVRLLSSRERRPVVLLGPRQCGKTAVIHEAVFRRMQERSGRNSGRSHVWLVSPQRLISGMSYVGQWEGRLLAILRHARKREHILYFDDLIGLFLAGQTSQSSLSASMVLKPYLEQRTVRVLGELSSEQFRVLQERDRGFADLFHVLPIREPTEVETTRILIEHQRRLEGKHGCSFRLDALPAVMDLTRRYHRALAFPGKAATVLTRLAVRVASRVQDSDDQVGKLLRARPDVPREAVLEDFAAQSGLSLAFLDPKKRLDRDEIRDLLVEQVIGQTEAVAALADIVSVAKARLNDPDRPLASFLFLGPTGVGKTECAKAAARVLFGNTDRLLRIDLNEFNQPGSASRLVGTFSQPEGLLTAAVRRQPFSVILLDEIEKADRDVFDVLLQVLGEGRLTDALGRTADFTNAIILMTSNIGVRDAEGSIGFSPAADRSTVYTQAAERFFRPEFFNRLDRVIPFGKLTRENLGRIADRLILDVLAREGFGQRQCVMNVSPEAVARVVEAGYDPALGARAMKRAVERELTKPAAEKLAALNANEFTIVSVRAGDSALAVEIGSPGFVPRLAEESGQSGGERLDVCHDSYEQLSDWLATLRPRGPIGGRLTPEQERYFAVKERLDLIANQLEAIEMRRDSERLARIEGISAAGLGRRSRYRIPTQPKNFDPDGRSALRILISAFGMEESVEEIFAKVEPVEDDEEIVAIEQQLALARLIANAPVDERPTFLWIRDFAGRNLAMPFLARYLSAWSTELGVDLSIVPVDPKDSCDAVIRMTGLHARAVAETEAGTHLVLPKHGGPVPIRVSVVDSWPMKMDDPHAFGPIVRIYPEGKPMIDVRTGWLGGNPFLPELFRSFTLAALSANVSTV